MDETLNDILAVPADASRVLLVPTQATGVVPTQANTAPEDPHTADLNEDIDHAREQLKQLMDDARSAINGCMELASSSDKPGGYKVIAELITAATQAAKELALLHKTRKETLKTDKEAKQVDGGSSVHIENAVFTGRASELLRELQAAKKQQLAEDATITIAALAVDDRKGDQSDGSDS